MQTDIPSTCGRAGCPCSLSLGGRFVLWAVRQWRHDATLPAEGSALYRGFNAAGLLDALPDFAIAIDALLFGGARRAISIHHPTCARISDDEALLLALCELAQGGHDGPLRSSLAVLMAPSAAQMTDVQLKAFAGALAEAGLRLAAPPGVAGAQLN